jgi:hypothetical protein
MQSAESGGSLFGVFILLFQQCCSLDETCNYFRSRGSVEGEEYEGPKKVASPGEIGDSSVTPTMFIKRQHSTIGPIQQCYMEMIIRRFAGTFILLSLLLAHYHSTNWLWFTAFVGFNLLQSSFTNFCPLEIVLRKIGVGASCCSVEKPATPTKA